MEKYIYVVCDSDLGWDCAIAAFTDESVAEKVAEAIGGTGYVISVEVNPENYDKETGEFIG